MKIKDIFGGRKNQEIKDLHEQVKKLEQAVSKTNLNDTLAGIIGSRHITLSTNDAKNSYNNNYTIYRGINLLSDNIAQLPLKIYRSGEPLPDDFVLPRGFNLQMPHPRMSLNDLLYTCCVYYFYRGEFMTYIDEEGGLSLEPVNPKLMARTKDGNWKWNNKMTIPEDMLIYIPFLNPDGDRGLSPVDVVMDELLAYQNSNEYIKEFFNNYTQMGHAFYDELGQASKEDMKNMIDQIENRHAGTNNAYKNIGLPRGIKIQELGQSIREMQFLDSQKEFRDKFLAVLGIHKAVFGVTDDINYATADVAERNMWKYTLKPSAKRIENKFNQQFMKKFFPGFTVKFDFSGIEALQENQESKLKQAKLLRELGYTTNEINEYYNLGLDEIDDPIGEMRFVPSNLIPLEELLLGPEQIPEKTAEIDSKLEKIAKIFDETDRIDKSNRAYVIRFNRTQRESEKSITRKLRRHFSEQLYKILALVKENKSIEKINEVVLLSDILNLMRDEKSKLTETIKPEYIDGSTAAVKLATDAINATATKPYSDTVVEGMTNRISNIHNHTYKLIRDEVKESIAAGESIDQLTKRIQNVYKFNSSRARIIARTESANLMNRSTNEVYVKNEVPKKRWIDAKDSGVRPTHTTNDNMGVVKYDYVYPNGLRFPGDPNGSAGEVINCRCALIPVME